MSLVSIIVTSSPTSIDKYDACRYHRGILSPIVGITYLCKSFSSRLKQRQVDRIKYDYIMTTSVDDTQRTIVVLGATGATGVHIVEQALARNYRVIAPVRNPDKLAHVTHEHLHVNDKKRHSMAMCPHCPVFS
jgi:NADPH:quinone reductase-like Zn-dependent oxidoreductase